MKRKLLQLTKIVICSNAPFLERSGRSAVTRYRRLVGIPHQPFYAGIGDLGIDGLCLDIGANHGQSIESIRLYSKAPIVSFEILPSLADRLREQYADVTVHGVGLGNESGTITMYVPCYGQFAVDARASPSSAKAQKSLRHHPWVKTPKVVAVQCEIRQLDSFGLEPSFAKIDVEGAERQVLEGGMETIRRYRPVLLIEQGAKVFDLLKPLGYSLAEYAGGQFVKHRGAVNAYLLPS